MFTRAGLESEDSLTTVTNNVVGQINTSFHIGFGEVILTIVRCQIHNSNMRY